MNSLAQEGGSGNEVIVTIVDSVSCTKNAPLQTVSQASVVSDTQIYLSRISLCVRLQC